METVQIVLDKKLLQTTDRIAQRRKLNRSAFVREALRSHIRALEIKAMEEKEREAYRKYPQDMDDLGAWEGVAAWPED